MILLSPKPNFLALLSWKNVACIPGRSTNCWPVEGFQPGGLFTKGCFLFRTNNMASILGSMAKPCVLHWLSCLRLCNQTWWCWTTTDSLFGWTWTSQTYWGCSIRLTSLQLKIPSDYDFTSSKTVNLIFPKATWYNLPSCNLIQFGDIHNKPPSKTNSCRVG